MGKKRAKPTVHCLASLAGLQSVPQGPHWVCNCSSARVKETAKARQRSKNQQLTATGHRQASRASLSQEHVNTCHMADMEQAAELDPLGKQDVAQLGNEDGANVAASLAEYITACRDEFGIDELVDVQPGRRGLPFVYLTHPSGYSTEVSMSGATVTSLLRPDGQDALTLLQQRKSDSGCLRGGIQPVFLQYDRREPWTPARPGLPANGILNRLHWSICESSACSGPDPQPSISLVAESDSSTLTTWPHRFSARFSVQLMGAAKQTTRVRTTFSTAPAVQLRCSLTVQNEGDEPMAFVGGLQSHLALAHTRQAELYNLPWGNLVLKYELPGATTTVDEVFEHRLQIAETLLDRIYVDARQMSYNPGNYSYKLELLNCGGFTDMGVWHPYSLMPDPDMDRQFIAVSQGALAKPVRLRHGEIWEGEMVLLVHELTRLYGNSL